MRTPTFQPPRSDLRAARRVDVVHELRAIGAEREAPRVTPHEPGVALTDGRGAQRRRGVSSPADDASALELGLSCAGIAFAMLLATGWPLRWLAQLAEVLQ